MWKFDNFLPLRLCVKSILMDQKQAKTVVLAILQALNFYFDDSLAILQFKEKRFHEKRK